MVIEIHCQITLLFTFIVADMSCQATWKVGITCKTRENSNFLKKGKMVISVKIRNFSRSQMAKQTSPLESSHEI